MAMAVDNTAEKGEVSGCVHNLIHAFSNGLDIFKRLRERRRKRKSRKQGAQETPESSAEIQLSNSLRRGPAEIQESYDQHLSKAGDRFATGDAIAHASLAETLIKLNTGLVGIIAAFLNHDSNSTHLNLDYKSLTNLSNTSRAEAVGSLNQLYQRLSQSQLQVYRVGYCARCGSAKHQNCSGAVGRNSPRPNGKGHAEKRKHTSSRSKTNGPTVARLPIKSSSQTQLVVVRPRNPRKDSASSSSSTKSRSTSTASSYASPPMSPLPQYTAVDPYMTQMQPGPKVNSSSTGRRRAGSFDGPRPTTWPQTRPDNTLPLQLPTPQKLTHEQQQRPSKAKHTSPLHAQPSPPLREKHSPSPSHQHSGPIKRRMDKITPSTYTFASDSTKLGEIPQRDWSKPWDYEEAERLNRETLVKGYPAPVQPEGEKVKGKRGLFGFWRRGEEKARTGS
ncbi:hypothetical protein P154DRAFT_452891 [Amniculicola lignicola CBS 123094]|uniref:Uncharacterized protein n=1 Tax=Amniculicola lignicola CBS 123094 TaxID=1392246 RepID=A0A6A5X476_9PLEO|nr:hypothetical protein P154DRAFT_452891 [Amniculicola lignicola CBS 123094]